MLQFWLSKKTILEALKLSEGMSQKTMLFFEVDSERKEGENATTTVAKITAGKNKKTVKENFNDLIAANKFEL